MTGTAPPPRRRRQILGTATLVALACLFAADARAILGAHASLDPTGWIRLASSAAGAAVALWLLVTYAACAMATLPGRAGQVGELVAARIAPAALRRALAFALVAGAWTPVASYAQGALAGTAAAAPGVVRVAPGTDSLPDPSLRPDPTIWPDRTTSPSATSAAGSEPRVVVHPGDTLWDLAAQRLGPTATTPRIAVAWPVWFAANRPMLTDPDLIFPGQVLAVPATAGLPTPPAGTERP